MSAPNEASSTVAVLDTIPRGEKSEIRIELRKGAGGFFVVIQYYRRFSGEDWSRNEEARGVALFPEDLTTAAMALLRAGEDVGLQNSRASQKRDQELALERRARVELAYQRGIERARASAASGGRRPFRRLRRERAK
jgi:hypothetical protein